MKGMQKIKRGTGFRGVLEYTLENNRGEIIGGNMSGITPRELAQEFGQSRSIREDIEKPVWHNSLRLPKGERLDPEQWATIADDYMNKMGFGELHQRAYVLHDDEAGQHIHIIASRIDLMGKLYLGQNENLKSTQIIAQLEKQHGLTQTAQQRAPEALNKKTITIGEKGIETRTGEPPTRKQLQTIIDQATADKPPFLAFVQRLHTAEVSILPSGKTGTPQGVSFEYNGQAFKGSDLGKSYAWKQLQSRTDYQPSQDQGIIDQLRQDPSPAGMTQWNAAQEEAKAEQSAVLERIKQAQAEEHARQEQQAINLIADYAEQARQEWRAVETGKIQAEAQKMRDDAQKLQANEPEKPPLFGRKEWEKNHAELEFDVRMANKKARELEESIGWRLGGENKNKFEYDGMQRLKAEHPDLYQVWRDARQARQQEQEQQRQARKSEQKSHDLEL
jgi:hypothetical protein